MLRPPYNSKYPQKVLIPPGTFTPDENTVLDVPGEDEEVFVASKPRGQRPAVSSKVRSASSAHSRSVPERPHTQHSLVSVGPEPAELETREQENFEEDLLNFQTARRKLFYDVLTLQVTKLKKGVKPHLAKK